MCSEASTPRNSSSNTGTGVAIFDYDNDGWPDIFLVNGTTLEGFPKGKAPRTICIATITTELSRCDREGRTRRDRLGPGRVRGRLRQRRLEDLYVTYYGKNRLYHNQSGVFTEVGVQSERQASGKAWVPAAHSSTTIAMGDSI